MSGTSGTPSEHCGMSPTDTRDMAEPISASPFFCDSRSLSDLGKFVWYISVWGLECDISISRDFPVIWKLCHPAISYWSAARLENTRFSNQGSMATFSIWFITIALNISRGTIYCLQMLVTSICYNFGQQEPTLQLLTNLAWGSWEEGAKPDKIITPHWPLPSWNVLGPWKYPQTAVSKQFVLTKDLWINTKFAT